MLLDNYLCASVDLVRPCGRVVHRYIERLYCGVKNWALHEWMKNLYLSKGGKLDDEGFSGVHVVLTNEDLDALEESTIVDMSKAVEEARNALKEGHKVYYYSIALCESARYKQGE
jgi:hypothetical protein